MAPGDAQDIGCLEDRLAGLVDLGGRDKISSMLQRFADQLDAFLGLDPAETWKAADVHRMAGLAAMLGFSQVEITWRRLETVQPKEADQVLARQAAAAAISFVESWRGS